MCGFKNFIDWGVREIFNEYLCLLGRLFLVILMCKFKKEGLGILGFLFFFENILEWILLVNV